MQVHSSLPQSYLAVHRSVAVNGITLHTVQAGPEDGPLVVLLHGFPEFWYGWRNQIEPLAAAGYRLVVPDQRGYNISDKPYGEENYRLSLLAQDVVDLIAALGREKAAAVIGHDWGAAVAWHTAIRYPEWVGKLGILNVPHPSVMVREVISNPRQLLKSWYIFFFQIPGLAERLLRANGYAGMRQMMRASSQPGTFREEELERYVEAWSQPGALPNMLNWYRALFRQVAQGGGRPAWDRFGQRVRPPALILWGVNDIALSRETAEKSLRLCDQGELVFFENATHWVQHEEPGRVNEQLLNFLVS